MAATAPRTRVESHNRFISARSTLARSSRNIKLVEQGRVTSRLRSSAPATNPSHHASAQVFTACRASVPAVLSSRLAPPPPPPCIDLISMCLSCPASLTISRELRPIARTTLRHLIDRLLDGFQFLCATVLGECWRNPVPAPMDEQEMNQCLVTERDARTHARTHARMQEERM